MRWLLWIAGILMLLAALVCLTRVGVRLKLEDGVLTVRMTLGAVRFQVYPGKKRPERRQKEAAKPPAGEKSPEQKKKKALPPITAADIRDAAKTLWPPLRRALERTRRGIRVEPLRLSLTIGAAEDPAEGAQLYGRLYGAVWTAMPVLERLLVIPEPSIHIGLDFDQARTRAEGEAGLSIRIGTALAVGLGVGVPAVKWLLRFQRTKRPPAPQ